MKSKNTHTTKPVRLLPPASRLQGVVDVSWGDNLMIFTEQPSSHIFRSHSVYYEKASYAGVFPFSCLLT